MCPRLTFVLKFSLQQPRSSVSTSISCHPIFIYLCILFLPLRTTFFSSQLYSLFLPCPFSPVVRLFSSTNLLPPLLSCVQMEADHGLVVNKLREEKSRCILRATKVFRPLSYLLISAFLRSILSINTPICIIFLFWNFVV